VNPGDRGQKQKDQDDREVPHSILTQDQITQQSSVSFLVHVIRLDERQPGEAGSDF
jgi:hypothetical protein